MAISKLSRRLMFLSIIAILLISYTYNNLYKTQEEYEKKRDTEVKECKEGAFVAENYYKLFFYEYDLKELITLEVNILHNGKVVKTFYKEDKTDDYLSFEYNNLIKSDTIIVKIKKDIYYIHSFENDFWLKSKPYQCYLSAYKINNTTISGPRQEGFFLKKEDLN